MNIKPWLTAIKRKNISAPLRYLLENNYITKSDTILDYGCGHGFDLNHLKYSGYNTIGYDKFIETYSSSNYNENKYSSILCFYVLNTIDSEEERIDVLKSLSNLVENKGKIYLAVRSEDEFKSIKNHNFTYYKDGVITTKNTFQKYFSKENLHNLIQDNIKNINITYIPFNKKTLFCEISKLEVT